VSKFGDIVQALGYRWTRSGRESLIFRSSALLECLAAGVRYPITGGSSQPAQDEQSVRRWAEEGRSLGYWASQIRALASHVAIVNEVFSPTDLEIAGWRQLLDRYDPPVHRASAPDAQPAPVRAAVRRARAALEWAESLAERP
jgi:citrate lyase subunit beta/citryl-CoA lyase